MIDRNLLEKGAEFEDLEDTYVIFITENDKFKYLQTEIVDNETVAVKSNFSRGKKQQIKMETFVESLPRCPICGGYICSNSVSVDHIQRKQDGGTNAVENGQITHLYCNTTYKN